MVESDFSSEELEAFRQDYIEAIEGNIEILITGQTEDPLEVDPFSLGLGDKTLAELDPARTRMIQEVLNKLIGRTDETQPVLSYESGEDDKLKIAVFEGQQEDEQGITKSYFLHEIKHSDGSLDWQLSASSDPLL